MRKIVALIIGLFLVAALVSFVATPSARAGPTAGSEQLLLASYVVPTAKTPEKGGTVAPSSGPNAVGLVAYTNNGEAKPSAYPHTEWVRVLVANGVRTTKWPRSLVVSAISFNPHDRV